MNPIPPTSRWVSTGDYVHIAGGVGTRLRALAVREQFAHHVRQWRDVHRVERLPWLESRNQWQTVEPLEVAA